MTQEDKQLLLKDLCGRLLYWPEITNEFGDISYIIGVENSEEGTFIVHVVEDGDDYNCVKNVNEFKPYLRLLSTMTEDEKKELLNITAGEDGQKYFAVTSKGIQSTDELIQYGYDWEYHWLDFSNENIIAYSDWLNKHHFDHRGLIEKGLALEAPKEMYKTE